MNSEKFLFGKNILKKSVGEGVTRQILGYDENIMVVKVAFCSGSTGSLHDHPHVQTTYVESGVFEVEIDGEKKTMSSGDGFFVPPGAVHGVVCVEEGVLIDVFAPMRRDFI